jgi:sterol 3beta-glucosyltransferase
MQLTLVTVGSRGDVQPFVALGQSLQAAGYGVRVATHEHFAPFVREHGLAFAPLSGDPLAILQSAEGQLWVESGENPVAFIRRLRRLLTAEVAGIAQDVLAACAGSDAILYSTFAFVAHYVALKLQIPAFAAPLQPLARTRAFPIINFPARSLGGPLNYASYLLGEQLFWQPVRSLINEWLAQLELAPESFWGPFGAVNAGSRPSFYGFSPHVVPPPADWGPRQHVTGYWFLDAGPGWQPPDDLVAFLEAGPPPVYIGFGSMPARDPQGMATLVRQALQLAGRRAVLLRGWGGLAAGPGAKDGDDEICVIEAAPHEWLFPRMAAVVHHAGAGTAAAGFRAGVPTVAVPFFADQAFWASRVSALGVGPAPIPRRRLSAGRLAGAIVKATTDAAMQRRAAELGERIRAERGVVRVLELLAHYCQSGVCG